MHKELDGLDLLELVDRLDDLAGRRTPVGWTPDDAVVKTTVERRIMEIVSAPTDEEKQRNGVRLPCDLEVDLSSKKDTVPARLRFIGEGGAILETNADFPMGTHVHVQLRGGTDERGLQVRGQIQWRENQVVQGLGVCFAEQPSDAHERRLHRFVMEVLRHRA